MGILLALTLFFVPTYQLKFNLFGLPTNLLMVWIFLFWVIAVLHLFFTNKIKDLLKSIKKIDLNILIAAGLFFISGVVGLFYNGLSQAKLGQFIVLILQPLGTFLLTNFILNQDEKNKNLLIKTLYGVLGISGIIAIIQYFSLLFLPTQFWGNAQEPKRAIAFFIHPNFYALWCAPLLAFLIPDLQLKLENFKQNWRNIFNWIVGSVGLFLSLSRAGWLGLVFAVGVYLIFVANKKTRRIILLLAVATTIVTFSVPNFRYRILLPFVGEKSAVSRFSLWQTGIKGIEQSPALGLGLNGFSNKWKSLNSDPNLDSHNFPHNIFLDFWVELGILGLLGFLIVSYYSIGAGFKNKSDVIKLGVAMFILALLVQGQIDNPYFKNDLALVFWIIIALI